MMLAPVLLALLASTLATFTIGIIIMHACSTPVNGTKVPVSCTTTELGEALNVIEKWADHGNRLHGDDVPRLRAAVDRIAPTAAPVAQGEARHPDDHHVEMFADDMKRKLATAREKGRGGWGDDEPSMQKRLSDMLRTHVEKGDPCDVANFCMFLHQRGESILPSAQPRALPGGMGEAIHQYRAICKCEKNDPHCICTDRWRDVSAEFRAEYEGDDDWEWRIVYTTPTTQPAERVVEGKCPNCFGSGECCLAGCSAHRSNWYKCETCNGTGKITAAQQADR